MQYIDITQTIINKPKQRYEIIEQLFFIDSSGNRHNVDNKYVVLEPTNREKEVANILGEIFGGEVRIIPRINKPEGIKTPDYIIANERFDLKQIVGEGKYVIEGNLRKKKEQSENFIIDLTNSKIDFKEANRQIENIYKSKRYWWINKILLLKQNVLIKAYQRK